MSFVRSRAIAKTETAALGIAGRVTAFEAFHEFLRGDVQLFLRNILDFQKNKAVRRLLRLRGTGGIC